MEIVNDDATTLIGPSTSKSTSKSRDIGDEKTCDSRLRSKSKVSSRQIKSDTRIRRRDVISTLKTNMTTITQDSLQSVPQTAHEIDTSSIEQSLNALNEQEEKLQLEVYGTYGEDYKKHWRKSVRKDEHDAQSSVHNNVKD